MSGQDEKPFDIPKRLVWQAWERVAENGGAPTGIRLELRSARPAGLPLQAASGLLCPATQRNWVAARLGVTLRDQ